MSVENIDSGSATSGFPERRENMADERLKEEKEDSSNSLESISCPVMVGSDLTADSAPHNQQKADVLAWVNTMSEDDLLTVFTMDDLPFLASILAASSLSPQARGQTDRSSAASSETSSLWRHTVSLSEIRAVLNKVGDAFKADEGVLVTSQWISSIQASVGESRSMSSEVVGKPPMVVDDIRIRHDGETEEAMSDIQVFWALFEHVRVVFPSAVSFVMGDSSNSSTLLTLSPSIIRKFGARKVYDALNAGMQLFLPGTEFLYTPSASGKQRTWSESLCNATLNDDQEGQQIPLFAVLLFRLERAFRDAYQAAASAADARDSAQGSSQDEVVGETSPDYRDFTRALDSRLRQFDEVDMDDEKRKSVTSDLAKACGGTDVQNIILANLLVTPLTLVSRSMENEGGSLTAIDEIIKSALERFQAIYTEKPSESVETEEKSSSPAQASTDPHSTQDSTSQKGSPKKKKKRKSKKKQGKGRAADTAKEDSSSSQNIPPDADTVVAAGPSEEEEAKPEQENENKESTALSQNSEEPEEDSHEAGESESVASETPIENVSAAVDTSKEEEVPTTATDISTPVSASKEDTSVTKPSEEVQDDGDTWETVEVKPRNQRKKGLDRANTLSSRNSSSTSTGVNDNSTKKSKEKRTAASRRKNATRKMVREILSNVVDSVEDESLRKQKLASLPSSSENRWKKGPPLSGVTKQPGSQTASEAVHSKPKTLRDIVMGTSPTAPSQAAATTAAASRNLRPELRKVPIQSDTGNKVVGPTDQSKKRQSHVESPKRKPGADAAKKPNQHHPKIPAKKNDPSIESPKRSQAEKGNSKVNAPNESPIKQNVSKWPKAKNTVTADQNTAPTYQETVSAMSGTSNRVSDMPAARTSQVEQSKSDSSSGDIDEAPQNRDRAASPVEKEASSSAPPLLTFVSPENANSATSSVASSLEVPHASRRHHHSASTPDATDVGYHLLDVCDRLSRDMNLFMESREHAINVRRRERGAVLVSLQDSLSKIWPGMCRVEMYGSCATLLDLPSADLDVVVVGLDHSEMMLANQMASNQQKSKRSNQNGGKHRRSHSKDGSTTSDSGRVSQSQSTTSSPVPPPHSSHVHHGAYVPLPLYRNSERVKQLAVQLEDQPWAVKIKSLPNATVPVIKILADPSKLPGLASGSEWPSPVSDSTLEETDTGTADPAVSSEESNYSGHPAKTQNLYEPWRGSDVTNGLISLDITFEGPEHGGLGSTEFSMHVVNDACQESGSPPEATPFVQCLMVLKELLVQRKLNEPYSGGLSSYALLLLLLGLVRERALIRQEIERAEFQRQAMAEGSVTTYAGALSGNGTPPGSEGSKVPEPAGGDETPAASMKHTRSWANIAKKSSTTPTPSVSSEVADKKGNVDPGKQKLDRPASFADAVARPMASSAGKTASSDRGREELFDGKSSIDDKATSTHADVSSSATPTQKSPVDQDGVDPNSLGLPSFYPQGFDDVIEVLCTGETTAGKLLMHFLLYYGQYFDAQATAIDISGKHERVFMGHHYSPYSYLSPYIPRRAPETIDPHTGMLVVDHIVVYDPLEGAETNNVARRCFAWQQVKWIFSQSYATLSSAVERSSSPPATPSGRPSAPDGAAGVVPSNPESTTGGDLFDPSSPLLRCLLSF